MRCVIISDTHGMHDKVDVPDGDLLIHAGDICARSTMADVAKFSNWFIAQPHRYKVVCPGNHDWPFEQDWNLSCSFFKLVENIWILHDCMVEIEGLQVYGTAWQPFFNNWAFNIENPASLKAKYDHIPTDTDILVTHCPPYGILDELGSEKLGPKSLLNRVKKIKPKLHCFGHIHFSGGKQCTQESTIFVNGSVCDEEYKPINKAILVDL